MDIAGASRSLHAPGRLLGGAALAALLVLALSAGAARAQAPSPPSGVPGQGAPDQIDPDEPDEDEDEDWDGGEWDGEDDDPDGDFLTDPLDDALGGQPSLGLPGLDLLPGRDRDGGGGLVQDAPPLVTSTHVAGTVARLRTDGKAAIPRGAPKRVRALIAQYNRIVGKRYKWGGGHARLADTGYDCSGAVGYGLITSGMQRTTMVSGSFARWGAAGAGRWITVYAHKSHVYVEVAGLRLDTSAVGDRGGRRGVRWRPVIGQRRGFKARHPVGL